MESAEAKTNRRWGPINEPESTFAGVWESPKERESKNLYVCVSAAKAIEEAKKTFKSKHAVKVKENVRANMWERSPEVLYV